MMTPLPTILFAQWHHHIVTTVTLYTSYSLGCPNDIITHGDVIDSNVYLQPTHARTKK
jgi:hypothetical protein